MQDKNMVFSCSWTRGVISSSRSCCQLSSARAIRPPSSGTSKGKGCIFQNNSMLIPNFCKVHYLYKLAILEDSAPAPRPPHRSHRPSPRPPCNVWKHRVCLHQGLLFTGKSREGSLFFFIKKPFLEDRYIRSIWRAFYFSKEKCCNIFRRALSSASFLFTNRFRHPFTRPNLSKIGQFFSCNFVGREIDLSTIVIIDWERTHR